MQPGGKPTLGPGFTFGPNTGATTTSTTPAGFSFGSASGAATTLGTSGFNFGSSFTTPAATSNTASSTPAFATPSTLTTSGVFGAQQPSSTGLQFGAVAPATGLLSTTQTNNTGLLGTVQPSTQTTGLFSGVQTSTSGLFGTTTQASTPVLQGAALFSAKLPSTPQNTGLFNAPQASTPAAQGTSLFSAKLPSTTKVNQLQFGSPSMFSGVAAPPQSKPTFSFGAPTQGTQAVAPKSTAPPLFGSAAAVTPSSGFSFGSAHAPSSGLSFGTQESISTASTTAAKPASGFNFGPGGTTTQATLPGTTPGFGLSQSTTPGTIASGGIKLGTGTPSIGQPTSTNPGLRFGTALPATTAAAQGLTTTSGFTLGATPTPNLAATSTQATTQASSTPGFGLGQSTTGYNLTGLLSSQAKTTSGTIPSTGTSKPATGFTLPGTTLGNAAKTTSLLSTTTTTTTTAKPVFGLGTPQTASTSSTGFHLGAATSTFGTTTTSASTGFKLPSTVPSSGSTTGFKLPSTMATTSTATTAAAGATPAASTEKYTYKQLEELVNKWNIELEDMEKSFLEQAAEVNFADRELMENGEKITALHSEVERAKAEQNRLDQELDFLVSQQNELEDLLKPLEESVKQHSAEYGQEPDREREKIYKMAGKCDGQLKGMVQDLREIIDYLNASNASQQQEENPVLQIAKILNVHMDSLQWIDQNSALLQKRVDEMARLSEIRKKEHERSFRLGFD